MGISRHKLSSKTQLLLHQNEEVYLDSSFILDCLIDESCLDSDQKKSFQPAKKLLIQLVQKKVPMLISTLAFDEVWYICLKLLYQRDNGKGSWQGGQILKKNPGIISKYKAEIEEFQKKILKNPHLRVIGVPEDTMNSAFNNMLNFKLAPRDSFHISVCCSEQAKYFITGDRDFQSIPNNCKEIDIKLVLM